MHANPQLTSSQGITPSLPLLWNSDSACQALGVSAKTLFNITAPRGDLPCVRLGTSGRILRYDPDAVRAYVQRRLQASLAAASAAADHSESDASAPLAE